MLHLAICLGLSVKRGLAVVLDSGDASVDYVGRFKLTQKGAALSWGTTTTRIKVKGATSITAELEGGEGGSR